jgi:Uma2 family endonuclease
VKIRSEDMSEVIDFEDEVLDDEEADMGSLNHGLAQGQLVTLLSNDERFTVIPELSLDASKIDLNKFSLKAKDELVPDISVYIGAPPAPDEEVEDDLVKVFQMPNLAIEVLSPSQSVSFLVRKIKALFALGIKSCWLVVPTLTQISVYSQPKRYKTFDFNDTEVVDEVMDIHLSIQKVFRWRFENVHNAG